MQQRRLDLGSYHWLDLTNASEIELKKICDDYKLPELVAADCLDPTQLPKLQRLPNCTFLMLRSFDEKSAPRSSTAQEVTRKLAVLWGDNFLITIHRSPLAWVDTEWHYWQARPPRDLATIVHDLVEECLYTYQPPIDRAAEDLNELEEKIFRDRSTRSASSESLETAYLMKKRASTFKRLIRLVRDLLPGLSKLGDPLSPALQSLKEEADRLFFYSDDLEGGANDVVQISISLSNNRMNEMVRMLTIVSIFLLPLNLITGVYGMNFEFMPEVKTQYGYPLALGTMFVIELVIYLVLRKRGWIRSREA